MRNLSYYETPSIEYPKNMPSKAGVKKELAETTVGTLKEIEEIIEAEYQKRYSEYMALRKKYNEELAELYQEFLKDLAEENGLTDHPKLEKLESMAYYRGHSGGLQEIRCVYEELMELIKD